MAGVATVRDFPFVLVAIVPEVSLCFFMFEVGAFLHFRFNKVGVPNGHSPREPFCNQSLYFLSVICDGVPYASTTEKRVLVNSNSNSCL